MKDQIVLIEIDDFYNWQYEDLRVQKTVKNTNHEIKTSDGINFRLADGRITSIGKNNDEYIKLLEARNSYKRFDRI